MLNLPVAVQPIVETAPPGPVVGAVAFTPDQPAPVVVENNESAILQRVANAADILGINLEDVKSHLTMQLEAAAAAFVNAKVGSDKTFLQAEGVRIMAGLAAMFAHSSPPPVVDEGKVE